MLAGKSADVFDEYETTHSEEGRAKRLAVLPGNKGNAGSGRIVSDEETTTSLKESSRITLKLPRLSPLAALFTFSGLLGLWQLLAAMQVYPPFILPSPEAVISRFLEAWAEGNLWHHIQTTLFEAGAGFGAAFLLVGLLAYPMVHSRLVATILSPLLAATQAIPLVALAPLLVIWFGFGLLPKVITCALIVFFPLLLNTVSGLRSVEKSLLEAAKVFGASRWQTLWMVELPLALPSLLTGVKIGFTISITGAVIGEFITSDSGLGYLLNLGRGQFDTPLVFVALLLLTSIAMLAYGLVSLVEKVSLRWR